MKQKDYAIVAVAIIISAVLSWAISNYVFGSASKAAEQAEVVPVISSDFPEPSDKYFNNQSINPTQLIQIDSNANPTPFSE